MSANHLERMLVRDVGGNAGHAKNGDRGGDPDRPVGAAAHLPLPCLAGVRPVTIHAPPTPNGCTWNPSAPSTSASAPFITLCAP